MLATLVIGLREGLEAALIVGIIAAFLRKNGQRLTAMWLGVVLAVLLSIGVGVGLDAVERALPQAGQEGMETVIGAIAILFVTGMILWMNAHARDMKRQLESEAAQALSQAGAYALASMAFLAVLKEGFETSVFLLATFQAAQSAAWAATGAIAGLLMAAVIGWGIYVGGVRINLSRFFRVTGAFLILVAAGLVITSLRTGHEAGWFNGGQQPTINLSWLVAPGTIQSALITGVLGIPADPRRVEVLGWLAYLVPVALVLYWPQSRRLAPRRAARLQLVTAAALGLVALAVFAFLPRPRARGPAHASLVAANGAETPIGTARLPATHGAPMTRSVPETLSVSLDEAGEITLALPPGEVRYEPHDGFDSLAWTVTRTRVPAHAPATLTLDQVVALSGGRIPLGLNPQQHPGPFTATWSARSTVNVWTAQHLLLDATGRTVTAVTLSGGGLRTPRTLAVTEGDEPAAGAEHAPSREHLPAGHWRTSAPYRHRIASALRNLATARASWQFWAVQVPIALVLVALVLAASACRALIRARRFAERPADRVANPLASRSADRIGERLADHSAAKGVPRAS
ncbi:MAG: iron uptake transporter permease EfeU, partial [Steroidobacteraceae bacterium]